MEKKDRMVKEYLKRAEEVISFSATDSVIGTPAEKFQAIIEIAKMIQIEENRLKPRLQR